MSTTVKRFDYLIENGKPRKEGTMRASPFVQITVSIWMTGDTGDTKQPIVSAHLMSDAEINEAIQALKDNLDAVGKNAKAALRKAKDYSGS